VGTTLQWYTWNLKNKKVFLTILTAATRPINVRFSENFVINNRMLLFVSEIFRIYYHLKSVTIFLFFFRYARVCTRSFRFFSTLSKIDHNLLNTSLINSYISRTKTANYAKHCFSFNRCLKFSHGL
jgi:hypothetical protein